MMVEFWVISWLTGTLHGFPVIPPIAIKLDVTIWALNSALYYCMYDIT